LDFESFTDHHHNLRQRTGTDAESAFDDARLAADVLREVEDRRVAFARARITSNPVIVA
jgi:hypothetical protein